MTGLLIAFGSVLFMLFLGYLAACAGADRLLNPIDWFFLKGTK